MKKIVLFLIISINVATSAQEIYVRSWGANTCGEVLSNSAKNNLYKSQYSAFVDGYISHHNWSNDSLASKTLSNETIEQLWRAKCSLPDNITKRFIVIVNEILEETKQKKQ